MVFCEYVMKIKFEYDIYFICIYSWIVYFCKVLKCLFIIKVLLILVLFVNEKYWMYVNKLEKEKYLW